MAAFQFPDPQTGQTTVVNPITGSTYQWKEPPGKWVVTVKMRDVGDIIWEGDNPPSPIGDYKLWYSTDTLELYFYYCDAGGTCAWVPTSAPITMLEDLDEGLSEVKLELVAANVAINENTNRIESFIYFGEEAPVIYPDVDTGGRTPDGTDEGAPIFEQDERNYKLWLNTTTDKLSVLRIDESADVGYSYQKIDTDNNVTLQEVTENGNSTNQGIEIKNSRLKTYGEVYFQNSGDTPVTLDSGSSYKPMLHLKSYSNTTTTEEGEPDAFARKDVLKINARGEAELFGHLKAEPGENTNQVIVYEQYKELQDSIVSLQQEIEKLSLVLDEGGDYRLLSTPENPADFIRNGIVYFGNTAGNPLTDPQSWSEVGSIFIDTIDRNGNTHDFGPDVVRAGDLIELVGDNSFALFEVKGTGQYEEGLDKKFALWGITTIKSTGVPGPNDTEYTIKSFRLGSLDVAETDARYVNLTGDEMTGALQIKPSIASTALDIFPGPNQSSGTSIFRVFGDGNQTNLYVSTGGNLGARQGWSPSLSNHLTTKNYVDLLDAQTRDYVDSEVASHSHSGFNSQALWKAADHQRAADLQVGEFFIADGGNVYFHPKSDNGFDLGLSSSATGEDLIMLVSIYSTNGNSVYCITTDKITFNNGSNKYIRVQKIHERHNNRTISAGTQYALKVPGFTP